MYSNKSQKHPEYGCFCVFREIKDFEGYNVIIWGVMCKLPQNLPLQVFIESISTMPLLFKKTKAFINYVILLIFL